MTSKFKTTFFAAIALCIVYSAVWFTFAFAAEDTLAKQIKHLKTNGMKVSYGKIKIAGFPYRIVLHVKDMHISTPKKGLIASGENIKLISHIWTPRHWIFEADNTYLSLGRNIFSVTDTLTRASYKKRENGQAIIVMEGSGKQTNLRHAPLLQKQAPLKALQIFLRLNKLTESQIAGSSDNLYADALLDFKIVMKTENNAFEFEGDIAGPDLARYDQASLAKWRDKGGLINLTRLNTQIGEYHLSGEGSFTLDDQFKLLGSLSFKANKPDSAAYVLDQLDIKTEHPITVPNNKPFSIMVQSGVMTIDGTPIMRLSPVIIAK